MNWRHKALLNLSGIERNDAGRCFLAKIDTANQLFQAYEKQPEPRLVSLAKHLDLSETRTARLLAATLTTSTRSATSDWLAFHWADAAAAFAAVALAVALVWPPTPPPAPPPHAGRRALNLTVRNCSSLANPKLPLEADLLFSSRVAPPAGVTLRVMLTAFQPPSGDVCQAAFTLDGKDLPEAAKWIGLADVTISPLVP